MELRTEQDLRLHYKAVHDRLTGRAPPQKPPYKIPQAAHVKPSAEDFIVHGRDVTPAQRFHCGVRVNTLDEVIDAACRHFRVHKADLVSRRKDKQLATQRQITMYVASRLSKCGYSMIGRVLGDRDHSTIVKGIGKIVRLLDRQDPEVSGDVVAVRALLNR